MQSRKCGLTIAIAQLEIKVSEATGAYRQLIEWFLGFVDEMTRLLGFKFDRG